MLKIGTIQLSLTTHKINPRLVSSDVINHIAVIQIQINTCGIQSITEVTKIEALNVYIEKLYACQANSKYMYSSAKFLPS